MAIPAQNQLFGIKDIRIKEQIRKRIRALADDPDKQGKPLNEDLYGYRSVRTVGQRYRVIYKLEDTKILVLVVMIGMRKEGDKKDVYAVAKKLARLGLLDLVNVVELEVGDKTDEDTQLETSDE